MGLASALNPIDTVSTATEAAAPADYLQIGHAKDSGGFPWMFDDGKIELRGPGKGHMDFCGSRTVQASGRVDPSKKLISFLVWKPISPEREEFIKAKLAKRWPGYEIIDYDDWGRLKESVDTVSTVQERGVETLGGVEVRVNPTAEETDALAKKHQSVRGLLDCKDGTLYVWDAATCAHYEVAKRLGYTDKANGADWGGLDDRTVRFQAFAGNFKCVEAGSHWTKYPHLKSVVDGLKKLGYAWQYSMAAESVDTVSIEEAERFDGCYTDIGHGPAGFTWAYVDGEFRFGKPGEDHGSILASDEYVKSVSGRIDPGIKLISLVVDRERDGRRISAARMQHIQDGLLKKYPKYQIVVFDDANLGSGAFGGKFGVESVVEAKESIEELTTGKPGRAGWRYQTTLLKESVDTYGGTRVLVNPTCTELVALCKKQKDRDEGQVVRGLVFHGDLYFWPAVAAIHFDMAQHIGDEKFMQDYWEGRLEVNDEEFGDKVEYKLDGPPQAEAVVRKRLHLTGPPPWNLNDASFESVSEGFAGWRTVWFNVKTNKALNCGALHHTQYLRQHPGVFGLSRDDFQPVTSHEEEIKDWSAEAKARSKGWVRIALATDDSKSHAIDAYTEADMRKGLAWMLKQPEWDLSEPVVSYDIGHNAIPERSGTLYGNKIKQFITGRAARPAYVGVESLARALDPIDTLSIKEAKREEVGGIACLVNPTFQELMAATKKSREHRMRGYLDLDDTLYWWDSYYRAHDDFIRSLQHRIKMPDDICCMFKAAAVDAPPILTISPDAKIQSRQSLRLNKLRKDVEAGGGSVHVYESVDNVSTVEGLRGYRTVWYDTRTSKHIDCGKLHHTQMVHQQPATFGVSPKDFDPDLGDDTIKDHQLEAKVRKNGWVRINLGTQWDRHDVDAYTESDARKALHWMAAQPEWVAADARVTLDIGDMWNDTAHAEHLYLDSPSAIRKFLRGEKVKQPVAQGSHAYAYAMAERQDADDAQTYLTIGHKDGGILWAWRGNKIETYSVADGLDAGMLASHGNLRMTRGADAYGRADPASRKISFISIGELAPHHAEFIKTQVEKKWPGYELVVYDDAMAAFRNEAVSLANALTVCHDGLDYELGSERRYGNEVRTPFTVFGKEYVFIVRPEIITRGNIPHGLEIPDSDDPDNNLGAAGSSIKAEEPSWRKLYRAFAKQLLKQFPKYVLTTYAAGGFLNFMFTRAFKPKPFPEKGQLKFGFAAEAIDAKHDVPYLGGTNLTGKVVYIDRSLPKRLDVGGRKINVWKYIAAHEQAEKPLMDGGEKYQTAHRHATAVEKATVKADGIDWKKYCAALRPYILKAEEERDPKLPADLNPQPYVDSHESVDSVSMNWETLDSTDWRKAGEVVSDRTNWKSRFVVAGKNYQFWAYLDPDDPAWWVEFGQGKNGHPTGTYGITGSGDSFSVFSAVASIFREFIDAKHPVAFKFSSDEPSRTKLYRKFAQYIKLKMGYQYTAKAEYPHGIVFRFTRPTAVAETLDSRDWKLAGGPTVTDLTHNGERRAWEQKFSVGGKEYVFSAYCRPGQPVFIVFMSEDKYADDPFGITGSGDPFKVFSAVANILQTYVHKEHPEAFTFSAKEPSRVKLYRKFCKLIEKKLGYTFRESSNEEGTNFLFAKTTHESLQETLDSHDWSLAGPADVTPDEWRQGFMIGDKEYEFYAYRREHTHDDWWRIEFSAAASGYKGRYGVTGSGHQFAVFAAVSTLLKEFLAKKRPHIFDFSAEEPSRVKLYTKFADHLEKAPDYARAPVDKSDYGHFMFRRKDVKVESVPEIVMAKDNIVFVDSILPYEAIQSNPQDKPAPRSKATGKGNKGKDAEKDFHIGDVQDYVDMQILTNAAPDVAVTRAKEFFHIKDLDINPIGKVSSSEVPDKPVAPATDDAGNPADANAPDDTFPVSQGGDQADDVDGGGPQDYEPSDRTSGPYDHLNKGVDKKGE